MRRLSPGLLQPIPATFLAAGPPPARPAPWTGKPPYIHVETRVCPLPHCGWSGFHLHWRHRRYRSFRDVPRSVAVELDRALVAANHPGWVD